MSEPKSSGNYIVYTAKITPFNNVFITVPWFTAINYGQTINVIGTLKVKVLNNKSVIMSMYLSKIEALKNKQNFLLEIMSNIREKIIFLFEQTLPLNLSSLLLGTLFYAILSGLQASIMGIMLFVAQFFDRQYLVAYGLFLAGLLMLFYNPATLFDIGFQYHFYQLWGF